MSRRRVVVEEARANFLPDGLREIMRAAEPGRTSHLILGFDADRMGGEVDRVVGWLDDFWSQVHEADPHTFAATAFVLDWPDPDHVRLKPEDVDRLAEAGVCFRAKSEEFYPAGSNFATALRGDLIAAGVISEWEEEALDEAIEPPAPPDDPGLVGLLGYYADPPFAWPAEAIKQILGDRSRDASIRLPR